MSTVLQVRIQQTLLGEQALSGAVADLLPITSDESAPSYRGIVVPVGMTEPVEIEVVSGRYLLRAYLPSGTTLSQQVVAGPDTKTAVVLEAERTPHEWLGWQRLTHEARFSAKEETPFVGPRPKLQVIGTWRGSHVWNVLAQLVNDRAQWTGDMIHGALGPSFWSERTATSSDDSTCSFIVASSEGRRGGTYYAILERAGEVDVMSLPMPWMMTDGSGGLRAANLDIAAPHSPRQAASLTVRDPEFGSLLGYLGGGRLPLAKAISDRGTVARAHILQALAGKLDNPLAAAAGAYLLLMGDPAPDSGWHHWVENLVDAAPWLPDGPALLGALRLRFASTDADVAAARAAFSLSLARGVPVFAPILRLLLDGMTTLVDDPEADAGELEGMLPAVRSVARALVTSQAVTAIHLGEGAR